MCVWLSLCLSLCLLSVSRSCVSGVVFGCYTERTQQPAAQQQHNVLFSGKYFITHFLVFFFVIRLFPSSSYSDVIIILLENMFPIFFFVIIFYSFYLIPYKGEKGRLDYTRTQLLYTNPLCTLFSTQIPTFSFLYFFFCLFLFIWFHFCFVLWYVHQSPLFQGFHLF